MKNKFVLVLDTNVLYKDYNKNIDFNKFSFSSLFDNIQHKIEELDLVDYVTIALPEMCWEELKMQYIDEHASKLSQAKTSLEKYKGLPEVTYKIEENVDIKAASSEQVAKYKETILSNSSGARIIELPLPDEKCFKGIIARSINKTFPFHVTDKHSDYGFKDVVIWESILKFKSENKDCQIMLYSEDNGFHDSLCEEFKKLFKEDIIIVRKSDSLYELLKKIAKENVEDIKIYTPEPEGNEIKKITDWLHTSSFKEEFFRTVDKSMFGNSANLEDVSLLSFNYLSSNVDYDNYQLHMEILVSLQIEKFNRTEEMIKMFNVCIDYPYEEDLPILILDCENCSEEATQEWIKNMENENE